MKVRKNNCNEVCYDCSARLEGYLLDPRYWSIITNLRVILVHYLRMCEQHNVYNLYACY